MPERFSAAESDLDWMNYPTLAQECEDAGMTVLQAEAARAARQGASYGQIAGRLALPYDHARNTVEKSWRRLKIHLQLRDRDRNRQTDVLKCFRNRRSFDNRPGLIGLFPYREDPNTTYAELQALRADPSNYQDVPLRGGVLTVDDLVRGGVLERTDPLTLLRYVAEHLDPLVVAGA